MNRLMGVVSVSLLSLAAFAARQGEVTDEGYKITVEGADVTLNDDDVQALLPAVSLIKAGSGRLIIDRDLEGAGYAGKVYLNEGYIRATAEGALGKNRETSKMELHIASFASLEIDLAADKVARPLVAYVSGTGVSNAGAVYSIGSTERKNSFNPCDLYLEGDTLMVVSSGSWGPSSNGKLYLQNHTLRIRGGKSFDVTNMWITGPGEVSVEGTGTTLFLENNAQNRLSGSPVIRLAAGTVFKIGGNGPGDFTPVADQGSLIVDGDANLSYGFWSGGQDAKIGHYYGAITLNANLTTSNFSSSKSKFELNGKISGTGGIIHDSTSTEPLKITNAKNDFTGTLMVKKGEVQAVGLIQNVAGTGGRAKFDLSGETVTDDILYGYWRSYTDDSTTELKSDTFFDFGVQTPDPYVFSKALDDVIVSHAGEGTLTVTSEMSGTPAFKNLGGELVLAPATPQEIGWADVKGGEMTIAAGSVVKHPTNNITVAASYPSVARLKIRGTLTTEDYRIGIVPCRNAVSSASNARGIVEVFDGAVVTNIYPSNVSSGFVRGKSINLSTADMSSYYQHGGEVSLVGDDIIGSQTHYFPGSNNRFYYSLEGGNYTHAGCNDVRFASSDGSASYGVFAQSGGTNTVRRNGLFHMYTRSSQALYYQTGGLFLADYAQVNIGKVNWESASDVCGGRGYMTFDGPDALATLNHWSNNTSFSLCERNNSLAEINVNNGATLDMNGMTKAVRGRTSTTISSADYVGTRVRVNLNGGRIRLGTTHDSDTIFRNFTAGTDHVRIYAGGATINTQPTNWRTWSVGAALEAPAGNGVESIELSDEMKALAAWEYTGAPWVEIVDPSGVGTGATAVAVFDTTLGKVTGIRIMNRGENYPAAGVVANVFGGGYPNAFTLPCTVTPNVSGGLTKEGSGTLLLDAVNTYTGPTTLAGGTIKFGVDGAIRAESRFILAGGTLDMDGKTLSDGATAVTDWGVDVAFAKKNGVGAYTNLEFPAGSTLTVLGADTLPAEGEDDELKRVNILKVSGSLVNCPELTFDRPVTKGWHVRWVGQTLRAARDIGGMLIIR